MGRAPCCDKSSVKKGPWSPEEDTKLKAYIKQNGTCGNWIALPQKMGLKRCGKSCRLRWLNYLRPNIKHGGFSEEEDRIICSLYISIGSRWSIIAAQLPGRTDNDIKNYWNTKLKKKLFGKQRQKQGSRKGKEMTSMVSDNNNNQNPRWPELPVLQPIPYSDYEPRLNGHASIRKLLIKLGGKFSEDDQPINGEQYPQYPMNNSIISIYENPINLISSTQLDVLNAQYNMNHGTPLATSPLQGNFTAERMISNINSQNLGVLECLYEDVLNNDKSAPISGGNLDWEAMNPFLLPLPPIAASNDELLPGIILQEGALDDFRYPGH